MKCKCGDEMDLEIADDDPYVQPNYAFNVFHCAQCGMICKESVWNNPGQLWISALDEITRRDGREQVRGPERRQKQAPGYRPPASRRSDTDRRK